MTVKDAETTKKSEDAVKITDTDLKGWGQRHQQCLILFCCLTVAYSMRACMGVCLVAMTISDYNKPTETLKNASNFGSNYSNPQEDYKVDGFLNALLLTNPVKFGKRGDGSLMLNNLATMDTQHSNNTQYPNTLAALQIGVCKKSEGKVTVKGKDGNGISFLMQKSQPFIPYFMPALCIGPGTTSGCSVLGLISARTRYYPKFQWSKKTQDTILASFFWGYMLLQIPAGQLAHRFGSRYLLSAALFINCVLSFSLPWAAYYGGWICVLVFRIGQGLSQACIIPGMHTLLGKWTPLRERGRLSAYAYGGQALGPVLGLPLTGFIASSALGWPGVFRFYGIISGFIGGLVWWKTVDTPAKHTKISAEEREYIENDIGSTDDSKKPKKVPWGKILTHRGMYAIIIAHVGQSWGQLTLYSEVPAFMDKVMGVNLKANGLLTALPFLVMWFANFFFSWAADMLVVKNILNVTQTRKLAQTVGSIPAAVGLIVLAYVPKDLIIVETVLVFICLFKIATHVGVYVNHIDISPNFSGTMMSISNFCSNLFGSLAPIVAGFILTDVSSEYLWRKVFFVTAGLYLITNIFYVILGTAERAEWNEPSEYENATCDPEGKPMIEKHKC